MAHALEAERFRNMDNVTRDTPCIFRSDDDLQHLDVAAGPAVGIEEEVSETIFETTSSNEGIKFWPWVNQVSAYFLLYCNKSLMLFRHR